MQDCDPDSFRSTSQQEQVNRNSNCYVHSCWTRRLFHPLPLRLSMFLWRRKMMNLNGRKNHSLNWGRNLAPQKQPDSWRRTYWRNKLDGHTLKIPLGWTKRCVCTGYFGRVMKPPVTKLQWVQGWRPPARSPIIGQRWMLWQMGSRLKPLPFILGRVETLKGSNRRLKERVVIIEKAAERTKEREKQKESRQVLPVFFAFTTQRTRSLLNRIGVAANPTCSNSILCWVDRAKVRRRLKGLSLTRTWIGIILRWFVNQTIFFISMYDKRQNIVTFHFLGLAS